MRKTCVSLLCLLALAVGLAASRPASAQGGPTQFESEPDKTMAAANEAFLKGNMNKAAEDIGRRRPTWGSRRTTSPRAAKRA